MNKFILTLLIALSTVNNCFSQKSKNTPNINGTTMVYQYQDGGKVKGKFQDNLYHFEWTEGPYKGVKGKVGYKIIKVAKKKYFLSFIVQEHSSLVTLYIDFKKRKLYGSAFIEKKEKYFQSLEEAKIIGLNFKKNNN
ncbi:conserved hypothetical protein [Tenacibaculum sp. 190524A05c]|uniref:MoaF N-terminal domain-containing protein n=1 Tax=Tenacibaculum platacis TaxID=3137852 RepID=UPI0031FB83D1